MLSFKFVFLSRGISIISQIPKRAGCRYELLPVRLKTMQSGVVGRVEQASAIESRHQYPSVRIQDARKECLSIHASQIYATSDSSFKRACVSVLLDYSWVEGRLQNCSYFCVGQSHIPWTKEESRLWAILNGVWDWLVKIRPFPIRGFPPSVPAHCSPSRPPASF